MKIPILPRTFTALAFGLVLAVPVFSQTNLQLPGPSKGEVVAAVVGAAAVVTVVAVVIYHETHKGRASWDVSVPLQRG
jgi:CHASE1-domain containing sensor protein